MQNNVEALVQRYLATFNETDAVRRKALIEAVYAASARYTDPHADLEGPAAIDAFVGAIQARYPGVLFSLAGKVDTHHTQARFTWHAAPKGASEPVAIGFDVIALEGERIGRVFGFLDKSPG